MVRDFARKILILVAISFLFSNVFVKQSWAAKQDPSPDFADTPETTETNEGLRDQQTSKATLDYVNVAEPPPLIVTHHEQEYFYPYTRSLSARIGGVYDSEKFSDKGTLFLAGVLYLYRLRPNEYYDFGFDIRSDAYGTIHAERRWISGRSSLRPYVKAGVGLNLVPEDQLATFLKLKNYQARGAIGFEKSFINPMSFRYEFELLAGDAIAAILSVGYSWGW